MRKVRVVAAEGLTIVGPIRVQLSRAQWVRREALLGPWKNGAAAKIGGRDTISFKCGEQFGVDPVKHLATGKIEPVGWDWLDLDGSSDEPDDSGTDTSLSSGNGAAEKDESTEGAVSDSDTTSDADLAKG